MDSSMQGSRSVSASIAVQSSLHQRSRSRRASKGRHTMRRPSKVTRSEGDVPSNRALPKSSYVSPQPTQLSASLAGSGRPGALRLRPRRLLLLLVRANKANREAVDPHDNADRQEHHEGLADRGAALAERDEDQVPELV